jgi:hypothetical protein
MDTSVWGPKLWFSMFIIASNYPTKIDVTNHIHIAKKRYHKNFFTSFKDILPCKYCRRSYKKFMKEIPIKNYLGGRQEIMYWLYLMKDKVNKKLILQEKQSPNMDGFKTVPSPPFSEVCKYYDKFRAGCSEKTKTCRVPKIKN